MKSINYSILVLGLLGVIASIFNMIHDWSLSGMETLFPSAALAGMAFVSNKKHQECKSEEKGS